MKLDIGAIPKQLLLLQLYNKALYQAPKYDVMPAIRQTVAGKKGGMDLLAAMAIREKAKTHQYDFSKIDLGEGLRDLHVDLTNFEVDFAQYDEFHGAGTAESVVRELREALASEPAEENNQDGNNPIANIVKHVNRELLSQLNAQSVAACSRDTTATETSPTPIENDSFLLRLSASQSMLERYFVDPVINNDAESAAFLKDLKSILDTHKILEKYKKEPVSEFYMAWLTLIDLNCSIQQKNTVCASLFKKHSDQDDSFAGILFHLPKVILSEFLQYSSNETIYAYHQYRRQYKDFYPETQDYFAQLVKMKIHSSFYAKDDKQRFLKNVLNFFQNLNGINATNSWNNSRDDVKEALSCWMITNSLCNDDDTSGLSELLSDEYIQIINSFDLKLSGLLEAIESNDSHSIRLNSSSYIDWLMLQRCFKSQNANLHDRLFVITRHIEKEKFDRLYKIISDCKLQPNVILSNHALSAAKEDYNHTNFPGLFINSVVPFLKSKCTPHEFEVFLGQLVACINPVFYAHEEWAFENIRENLLDYWANQNPEKLIEAIKVSIHLKNHTHKTPMMDFVNHIPSHCFNDRLLDGLMTRLDTLEITNLFSVCSDDVQNKILVKLLNSDDSLKAIEQIRVFNTIHQDSAFPTRFKEGFVKHLKMVNPGLFALVQSEQLFGLKDQSEFERDLDNLRAILNNKQLTHDQRRSEIHRLSTLHQALRKNEDACSIVMQMFEAIPPAEWPYLFTYFDAQIIHWSFPQNEDRLERLRSAKIALPPERTNTWLNHKDTWENILLGTLVSISDMAFDYSEPGHAAAWALGSVQEALYKSANYLPTLPNSVLKALFLKDVKKSMRIFDKITERSRDKYDFHAKYIVDDATIASWLPDDSKQRLDLLYTAFSPEVLRNQTKVETEAVFLKAPYVRNDDEQAQLILRIVNARGIHIVNFFEQFSWESRRTIIQAAYKKHPSGTTMLLVQAMNNILEQIPQNSKTYFDCIHLLLSIQNYTEMDVFHYINQISNNQKLVDALSNLDFWKTFDVWGLKKISVISSRLAPENFYSTVTEYFEFESLRHFSAFAFANVFGAAEKIAIAPYHSYSDYLNSHPEEKAKYVQCLLKNIPEFMRNPNFKAIKFASTIIPDIHENLLKQLADKIKPAEQLGNRDDYAKKQRNKCLDYLVQVYGVEEMINKCRAYGLEKQVSYLENKFKGYPQILDQVGVLCKWLKAILDPDYRKSDKTTPIEWQKIHTINEKTLEVLLELAEHGKYPNYLILENVTGMLNQICERAKVGIDELSNALPKASTRLNIKLYPSGALSINGIFARDNAGNHLSKAGMKFANRYLSSEDSVNDSSVMKEEFNMLDRKSQALLQDEFSKQITSYKGLTGT